MVGETGVFREVRDLADLTDLLGVILDRALVKDRARVLLIHCHATVLIENIRMEEVFRRFISSLLQCHLLSILQ